MQGVSRTGTDVSFEISNQWISKRGAIIIEIFYKRSDYIMSIKLVKASYEYQDLIVDMLKEWIDYNNNNPEANTSPASIFNK